MKKHSIQRGLALSFATALLMTSQPVTAHSTYSAATYSQTQAETTTLYNDGTYYYATLNMPYADFYYGEINQVTLTETVSLETPDPVLAYRATGQYDAVSSATTLKSTSFPTTYYEMTETGVDILGIKDAQVAIPVALYNSIMENKDNASSCQNKLYELFNSMTFSDSPFTEYKIMSGDGTFSAMTTSANAGYEAQTVVETASATITTVSKYGNYQLSISGTSVDSGKMLGALLHTSDGKVYGLGHLENLWLKTSEISFAVEEFTESHGNKVDYLRHQDLVGKTITKVTYLVANESDIVVHTNLKVKTLLTQAEEALVTVKDVTHNTSGMTTTVTNGLAESKSYDGTLSSITFNNTALSSELYTANSDSTLSLSGTLTPGQYTATFTDNEYEDVNATFLINSVLKAEDIAVKNNQLAITSTDATIEEYRNAVTAVYVDGTNINGKDLGTILFTETGAIDFDATVTNRGTTTPLFTNGINGNYTLKVEAAGYPSIEAPVGASQVLKPMTGIALNKTSLTLQAGKNYRLKTTITPADTTDATKVTYKSSNPAVAKVSEAGVVTGVAAGTTKITAKVGSFTSTCTVTVTEVYGSVKLSATSLVYNGKNRTPSVIAKTKSGKTISSKYYTVTYPTARKAVGAYTVKVTFKGIYTGTATRIFTISPAKTTVSLKSAKKNSLTVNWKKASGATGYVIEYSTSKSFKNSKTVKVGSVSSKKLTKLTSNKTYYVRVKSYKTITVEGKKKTLYSSWSTVKSLKTTKK